MLPKRNRPARKGGEANPFASLRKQLTLVCVAATSLILCLMAAVSLFISERDFVESERTAFESRVGGVVLYLQSNEVLDWTYLARSEAGGRILLYLEDNGAPMLFRGGWMPRSEREALFGHVKESAFYRQVAGDWQGEGAGGQVRSAYARLEEFPGLGGEEQAYHLSMYEIPGGKGSKLLVALGDTRAEQVAVRRRRLVFGVTTLAAVVLLALFSWWFSGRVIAPVDRSRRQQTEFVAAASHELRTPLAAIRAGVAALRIAEDEENRERFSSIIDKESARASHLVEDLLMLASIDAKGWSITRGPVEPDELLRDAVAPFQPLAAEKEIGLELLLPARPLPLLTGDAAPGAGDGYPVEQRPAIHPCRRTRGGGGANRRPSPAHPRAGQRGGNVG